MKANRSTSKDGASATDDYIDACYAEWLMEQPDAQITGGDKLVERMEQQWGWDRFMKHFAETAPAEISRAAHGN